MTAPREALVHIYTGEGKGKTTAALGLTVRAAGHGWPVLFAQFLKHGSREGAHASLARLPGVEVLVFEERHPMFISPPPKPGEIEAQAERDWGELEKRVAEGAYRLLVLDELNNLLHGGWLPLERVLAFLEGRPRGLEVVITGRDAPEALLERADLVTEMRPLKHPYASGVPARRGIEF